MNWGKGGVSRGVKESLWPPAKPEDDVWLKTFYNGEARRFGRQAWTYLVVGGAVEVVTVIENFGADDITGPVGRIGALAAAGSFATGGVYWLGANWAHRQAERIGSGVSSSRRMSSLSHRFRSSQKVQQPPDNTQDTTRDDPGELPEGYENIVHLKDYKDARSEKQKAQNL